VRDELTALVRAVQARVAAGEFRGRLVIGRVGGGTLWVGAGYYDPHNVLWWPPAPEKVAAQELSVEDGVTAFLQSVGAET
jgi:predicted amidohydrolase